jgi:Uma2 family endonuclease
MEAITRVEQLDFNKVYSYADYLTWKFQERFEILKGKIFSMSPAPSRMHQTASFRISGIFYNFFLSKTCTVYTAPFDVRLINHKKSTPNNEIFTVVQPDICVICDESKLDDKGCMGSPDLIIEILSPGNSKKEMNLKFDLYEENGVKEYWIVEPFQKSVLIYILQNEKYVGLKPFTEDEKIKSVIFPELIFDVNDIFEL